MTPATYPSRILALCVSAVLKVRSNIIEEWESYLGHTPDARRMADQRPDIFGANAEKLLTGWQDSTATAQGVTDIIFHIKQSMGHDVQSELLTRLTDAGFPGMLWERPDLELGTNPPERPAPPWYEFPAPRPGVVQTVPPVVRYLVRVRDFISDDANWSDDHRGMAYERTGIPVDYYDPGAVRWGWYGALLKTGSNIHWREFEWITRQADYVLGLAINRLALPGQSRIAWSAVAKRQDRIDQINWAIAIYQRR